MSEGGQAVQHCQWLASLGDNAGVLDLICFEVSVAMLSLAYFVLIACAFERSQHAGRLRYWWQLQVVLRVPENGHPSVRISRVGLNSCFDSGRTWILVHKLCAVTWHD